MALTLLRHATQKPAPGPVKPDIGHSLVWGLSRCWLFNEVGSAGAITNVIAPGKDNLQAASTRPPWVGTGIGPGPNFNAAGVGYSCSWAVPSTWSVEFWVNPTAGFASNFGVVFAQATNEHGVYITRDGSDACYVEVFQNTALTTTAGSITKGVLNHVVVTYDSATLYRMYINGALVYTSAALSNLSGPLDHVGEHATDNPVQGTIPLLRVWDNRVLSLSQVQALYAEPYAMVLPRPIQRWFVVASAPAFDPSTVPWQANTPIASSLAVVGF